MKQEINEKLISSWATSYYKYYGQNYKGWEIDDFKQEARLGFIQARTRRPDLKGKKFEMYAGNCIRNFLRRKYAYFLRCDATTRCPNNFTQNPPETWFVYDHEKTELYFFIKKCLQNLSKVEKFVIVSHYWDSKSFADIGREINVTRERVRQLHHQAVKKLRSQLMFLELV